MRISIRNALYQVMVFVFAILLAGCSQNDDSSVNAVHENKSDKGAVSKDSNVPSIKEKKSPTTNTSSYNTKVDTMTIDVPPLPE